MFDKILIYLKRKRLLGLVGYIFLTGGIVYAIKQERTHSNQNRTAVERVAKETARVLAVQTHNTQIAGCGRTNDLRNTVKNILVASRGTVDRAVREGDISKTRGDNAKKFYDVQIAKLGPIDCEKAYPQPKVK